MTGDDLLTRPATELAGLVGAGDVTSLELVELSLARIEALDPHLGAFVEVDDAGARAAAAEVTAGDPRPLAGVPVAVKANRAVTGLRLTCGSSLMRDVRATHDHNVVRRLRAAGAIVVGTTAMPEWGILPVTEARRGTRGIRHAPPGARPAGAPPRSPRAWCRSRTATTAAARCASRRRAAAWSASSRSAGACRTRPSSASSSSCRTAS